MKTCTYCSVEIPDTYRTGLCLKCRKHNNYISKQQKYIQTSKERYAPIKAAIVPKHCQECNIHIGKSNTSGFCPTCFKAMNADRLREQRTVWSKRWYDKNGGQYYRDRYKNDINYRLASILRSRLNCALRNSKGGSAVDDLGCSIEEFKLYLESKWQLGMTWNGHGRDGWHIDHIIPLVSFDLTDPEQLKKACHYTNLQPLWAEDNLSKGCQVP